MSNARFSILQARAVSDKRVSNAQLRTLAALGTFGDKDGWCYPKLRTLAEMLGKSRQAVSMDIKALVSLGYVEVRPQYDAGGRINNLYRLIFDTPPVKLQLNTPLSSEVEGVLSSEVDALTPHINAPINDYSCEETQEYQRPIPEEEAIIMDKDEYLKSVERACLESFKNSGNGIDVADYPEEVQLVLATFCKLWNFHPPHRGRNKKGGQYAKWIDWGRDLLEACGEFGVKGLEAYRQTFEQYMAQHQGIAPFNVYSPGSLVNAVRGHVAMLRQAGTDIAGLTASSKPKTVSMVIGGVSYDIPVGMDGTMAVGGRIVAP